MLLIKLYLVYLFLCLLFRSLNSGEWLFHILIPWSNIEFLEIYKLKKGTLRDKFLVLYELYLSVGRNLCSKEFGDMLFKRSNIKNEAWSFVI